MRHSWLVLALVLGCGGGNSSNPNPRCGDGVIDQGEQCDDAGESMACNADCTARSCGDGKVNTTAGEQCDDANTVDTDACLSSCQLNVCGDGFVLTGVELCDDGNS